MKNRKPFSGFYIQGIGCISAQATFDQFAFLQGLKETEGNKLYVTDADYSAFFDAGSLRRMNRLVKFGTAAGLLALRDAAIQSPAAISTGTGLGLLETSQKFLKSYLESNEAVVGPTAFIQSTHNTVSSNIALITHCYEHNNTFSQKGFSFESTLFDAELLLAEGVENVLVGAYEEVSEFSYAALQYNGDLRTGSASNLQLISDNREGTICGEGAAFFVVSASPGQNTYARLSDVELVYKPSGDDIWQQAISDFLASRQLSLADIDLVISGDSGDVRINTPYQQLYSAVPAHAGIVCFKPLCGEYMTASSFAVWLGAVAIRHGYIPKQVMLQPAGPAINKVLICNSYEDYYTLMLLEK